MPKGVKSGFAEKQRTLIRTFKQPHDVRFQSIRPGMFQTEMTHKSRLVVAALRGGSGKTTLTMGLIQAFRGLGRTVVPFKKGPDFIDTGWLSLAAGRPCYNLDPFLMGGDEVLRSVYRHGASGVALIEGNRGLYDGMDEEGTFSTAELAKLTRSPVVIIVDCTMATRTVAAMVLGCLHFDPELRLAGVILNRIRGARHANLVRKTVEHYTGLPVLGVVRRITDGLVPERHMGLVPPQEHPQGEAAMKSALIVAKNCLNVPDLLALADSAGPLPEVCQETSERWESNVRPKIGVVRDSAFWFYYPENLEALQRTGAELTEVCSLRGAPSEELDGLYIGGGFPETHAREISTNVEFRSWLRGHVENGMPVYAECGGLMLLGEELSTPSGVYPMMGVFPLRFRMESKPQGHGYSILKSDRRNPFFAVGVKIKGHEFHYSKPDGSGSSGACCFRMERGTGCLSGRDGLVYKNVMAMYTHVHASGTPEWAEGFVRKSAEYSVEKRRGKARLGEAVLAAGGRTGG